MPAPETDAPAPPAAAAAEMEREEELQAAEGAREPGSEPVGAAFRSGGPAPIIATGPIAALAEEVARRGLVRRDNSYSSRRRGVHWDTKGNKWKAEFYHGGKQEFLGYFATEAEAKAGYDARWLELGLDPYKATSTREDAASTSSLFKGVSWQKAARKWFVQIGVDGKQEYLGTFDATAVGEVDAALAYDKAARVAGRPEKANFEAVTGELKANAPAQPAAAGAAPDAGTMAKPPVEHETPADGCTIGVARRGCER
jgi:hypothetical protein